MSGSSGILAMTAGREMAQGLLATLATEERWQPVRVCPDLVSLLDQLVRQPSLAAIIDIDPQPMRMLADLDPVIIRFPETRFILVTGSPTAELAFEAMRVGARQLLAKDAVASQLLPLLNRLVPDAAGGPSGARGSLMTVLSASGGCGATTIAINMANEIQLDNPHERVLLVDLDQAVGGVALSLGLRGQYGLADAMARPGGADPQLIRSSAVSTGRMSVLLSPATINFFSPQALCWQNLPATLMACRLAYGHTVIDAPRVPMNVAATLALASQVTLLVMQLSVKDIQVARDMRQGLIDQGVPMEQIYTVVNRYRRRYSMIGLDQAERALQGKHFEQIGNDYTAASRGINFGQPLADAAPHSCVRKDIRRLAEQCVRQVSAGRGMGGVE